MPGTGARTFVLVYIARKWRKDQANRPRLDSRNILDLHKVELGQFEATRIVARQGVDWSTSMVNRFRIGVIVGLVTLLIFPLTSSNASSTGASIDSSFAGFYEQSGGLPILGYAVSDPLNEDGHLVQYLERQRLELHPENAGSPYEVLLGHLGWQEAEYRGLLVHSAFQPISSGSTTDNNDFFPETGHNLRGEFRDYWHSHGLNFGDPGVSFRESLALFGYPISEPFIDPDTGLVTQYFERARFEFHPENAGSEYEILLGHLGTSAWERANGEVPEMNDTPQLDEQEHASRPQGAVDVTISVDRSQPESRSQLTLGVTHTQHSLDSWGDPGSVERGRELLSEMPGLIQNQHIMGWGADNPAPAPGEYDWSSLDRRVDLMRETHGTPVITLCCAPDWMKSGTHGQTDWSRLEMAPDPEHYADFAELARQVALRYPDVKHFLVWNEFKGFYDSQLNHWDFVGYTEMYNLVYEAVKSANPNAEVGGPYIVLDSWGNRDGMSHPSDLSGDYGTFDQRPLDAIEYWLQNNVGADFVAVDAWRENRDGRHLVDPFAELQKFADATEWLEERSDLPIWWAEWYAGVHGMDLDRQNAMMTSTLIKMTENGVSVSLRWEPEGRNDPSDRYHEENVWTDTREPGGGDPLPFYYSMLAFYDHFSPETSLYPVESTSSAVRGLASVSHLLLVNQSDEEVVVDVDEEVIVLDRYEVRLMNSANTGEHAGLLNAYLRSRFNREAHAESITPKITSRSTWTP